MKRLLAGFGFLLSLLLMGLAFPVMGSALHPRVGCTSTQICVDAKFEAYWSAQGGQTTFGLPLRSAGPEQTENGSVLWTQWFEHARLEWHAANSAPYQVLLGRLGVVALQQQGIYWQTLPKAAPTQPQYFSATGHAIDDVFWAYWQTHGVELGDRGISLRESLGLFGYPLSEAQIIQLNSGERVKIQWFERARLIANLDQLGTPQVARGLVGAEVLNALPDVSPPSNPTPEASPTEPSVPTVIPSATATDSVDQPPPVRQTRTPSATVEAPTPSEPTATLLVPTATDMTPTATDVPVPTQAQATDTAVPSPSSIPTHTALPTPEGGTNTPIPSHTALPPPDPI